MGTLTELQLRSWIKAGKALSKTDGDGLSFTLSGSGTATWILRYRMHGKQSELTLGRYPQITLSAARQLASTKRTDIQLGIDVAQAKQQEKVEYARAWTFQKLAESYLEHAASYLAESTLYGRKQQLRDYVYGYIGDKQIRDHGISPREIVVLVERCAKKSPHVAKLVLIAVREVFAHGVAKQLIEFDPSAQVKARAIIGPRAASRERIKLSDEELTVVLPAFALLGRANELTLKILLGTCVRINELVLAKWEHLDFSKNEWFIPAENAKNKKAFVVPLTDLTASWFAGLKDLAFASSFVLPLRERHFGREDDAHMEPTTMNAALNRLATLLKGRCRRFTPHDLRSTARSHLGQLGIPLQIAERCLNHSLGELPAIYDKHDYLEERRNALQLWSTKLSMLEQISREKIVLIGKAA